MLDRLLNWYEVNPQRGALYALGSLMLIVVGVLAFAVSSLAATVEVTWTHPTQFEDGTPLTITQLAQTRIEVGTCSSPGVFGTKQGEKIVPAPTAATTIDVAPGTWCYRGFSRATAAAGGGESRASGVVSNIVPWPNPNPPVLSTTVRLVYEVLPDRWDGAKLGRAVGTAPIGTKCIGEPIPTQKGEVYEVSLDAVTLSKMPKSAIVATYCG
jgi:hypothetical protein